MFIYFVSRYSISFLTRVVVALVNYISAQKLKVKSGMKKNFIEYL